MAGSPSSGTEDGCPPFLHRKYRRGAGVTAKSVLEYIGITMYTVNHESGQHEFCPRHHYMLYEEYPDFEDKQDSYSFFAFDGSASYGFPGTAFGNRL